MKKNCLLLICLALGLMSCNKTNVENNKLELKSEKTQVLSETELKALNIAFISSTIEAHELMLQSNANMAVTYSRGIDGKVSATFDSNGGANVDADVEGREIICKGESHKDIADCMDAHMQEFGVCLITYHCAVCASEGPCPDERENP